MMISRLHIHDTQQVRISPIITAESAIWQEVTLTDKDGQELTLVIFTPTLEPLLPVTPPDWQPSPAEPLAIW